MKRLLILPLLFTVAACETLYDPYQSGGRGGYSPGSYGPGGYGSAPSPYPGGYQPGGMINAQQGLPIPYRAAGNEPFWALDLDGSSMRFSGPGLASVSEPMQAPYAGPQGVIYRGQRIELVATAGPCNDGMSDRRYPDRVEVRVDGRVYRGCGAPRALFDQGGDTSMPRPLPMIDLARTNWRVTRINQMVVGSRAYLNFLPGEIEANFGCNAGRGSWRQDGASVTFGPIAATRMACPDLAQEQAAFNVLAAPAQARMVDRDTLVIESRSGLIELQRGR